MSRTQILISVIIILFSCSNKPTEGRVLKFSDALSQQTSLIDPSVKFTALSRSRYRIVACLKGDCPVCIYELKEWQKYISSWGRQNEAKALFIILSRDTLLLKHQLREIDFSLPVFVVPDETFFQTNKLSFDPDSNVFLINRTAHVLIAGSPVKDKKISEKYSLQIRK